MKAMFRRKAFLHWYTGINHLFIKICSFDSQ
jgi:hypothetical protein